MSDPWMMDAYQEVEDQANKQLEQDLLAMSPREAYALYNEYLFGPCLEQTLETATVDEDDPF